MPQRQSIPFDRIEAWFFDLDGTLMDTDDQAVAALAHRLQFLGAKRAERLARRMVMLSETPMNSTVTILDSLGLDVVLFGVRRWIKGNVRPACDLIPEVVPLLEHLAGRATLAVISTRPLAEAEAYLRQHDLAHHFALLVTQESTYRIKPHPEPIVFAMEKLGLRPEACAMVGDTPVDVRSARRAGVWAVGVLCGFGEAAELERAGAHIVLPSTADLLELLL